MAEDRLVSKTKSIKKNKFTKEECIEMFKLANCPKILTEGRLVSKFKYILKKSIKRRAEECIEMIKLVNCLRLIGDLYQNKYFSLKLHLFETKKCLIENLVFKTAHFCVL